MSHLEQRARQSDRGARVAVRLWRTLDPARLDAGWDRIAPELERVVSSAQIVAAASAPAYVGRALSLQGVEAPLPSINPEAFAGVDADGYAVVPAMYGAVTATKSLIGQGVGVGAAFRAGMGFLSVVAGTLIRDAGMGADKAAAAPMGSVRYIRVIQPGACSRCAILAGRDDYKRNFERHPRCKCTLLPVQSWDDFPSEGFYLDARNYFDDMTEAEQNRVFTKSGAWAIRNGADPVKVVNARRGALKSSRRPDGSLSQARLVPKQIGVKADGSPLLVYATPEGTSARSAWARAQNNLTRVGDERYRRTTTVRLMPEQIIRMAGGDTVRATELLKKYGYVS